MVIQPIYDYTRNNWLLKTGIFLTLNKIRLQLRIKQVKLNNKSLDHNVCNVLNNLQSQAFEINSKLLEFIQKNHKTLEDVGILMNKNLSRVNLQKASDLLRICYFNDKGVMDVCSCKVLLEDLVKRVQRARRPATGASALDSADTLRLKASIILESYFKDSLTRERYTWLDIAQSLAQRVSSGDIVTRDDLSMLLDQLQNRGS
ncbi:hypothetical protein L3X38_017102 [Prunus dulcis]|uniref:Uncharacterized protein n=1 Tax=Prunus dulcis TaxID=3755 RepID=A0AAD4W924_PRUDU|nr:hypothetical protein L3X38_017102 [Prunus dulcis]